MVRLGIAFLLILLMPAAGAASERKLISVNGIDRSYLVYVPPALSRRPLRLVFVLHGGNGTAAQTERFTDMSAFADRNGFAVVYPDAISRRWNDGRIASNLPKVNGGLIDDVAFLAAVADALVRDGVADPKSIYLTGISNGAMMAMRAGCERPDVFRAIASVAGSMPEGRSCAAKIGVPALLIHGTADTFIRYEGGPVAENKSRDDLGRVQPAGATVAAFLSTNTCKEQIKKTTDLNADPKDGTIVTVNDYDCPASAPVRHVIVKGGGHTWPGRPPRALLEMFLGKTTQDFNANEMIWTFFSGLPPR